MKIYQFFLIMILFNQYVYTRTAVYYGDYDDRMQYYELEKSTNKTVTEYLSYYQEIASSVCMITSKNNIGSSNVSGKSKLYLFNTLYQKVLVQNPGRVKEICDDLKFKDEFVVNDNGTGTLIDKNKILTANHVFTGLISKGTLVCIFNYYKKSPSDFPVLFEDPAKTKPYVLVNTNDIYDVVETTSPLSSSKFHQEAYTEDYLKQYGFQKYDWAVLTINRDASSSQKRMCYYNFNDIISEVGIDYQELCLWGHPKGLPMIYTDDGHGKRTNEFMADLDVYSGNSGSAVFMKRKTDNFSTFDYKIIGVVSAGYSDFAIKDGKANGVECRCWADVHLKPTGISGYIGISLIDDLWAKSGVSYNSCTTPWIPPVIEPKPTTKKQLVPGEEPLIRFLVDKNDLYTYIIRMRYKKDNKIFETASVAFNNTSVVSKKMKFLPAGTDYNYTVFFPDGKTPLTSGSGKAAAVTLGYATTSTNTASVAFVGNGIDYPFKTIQSAIDNSLPNTVLHIARGVYEENIVIDKPITIIGEEYPSTMLKTDPSCPAILITSDNVSISQFFIKNTGYSGDGITLESVSGCNISNNQLFGYPKSICITNGSTGNFVKNNVIYSGNSITGIELNASNSNIISNNIVDYGFEAIKYVNCSELTNNISGNILNVTRKRGGNNIIPVIQLLLE